MTAQGSDCVIYRERAFSLAGISGEGLFDPHAHGLRPAPVCSACWRGYMCTYAVAGAELHLRELRVFCDERQGPPELTPVFGVRPDHVEEWGQLAYAFEAAPVPFTGGLLLGADFIDELYVHMGFHPAWKFREVHELIFDSGRLAEAKDCSAAAEAFRQRTTRGNLAPTDPSNRQRVMQWIEQSFTLDYERGGGGGMQRPRGRDGV